MTKKKQKVAIIGAGVAGCAAAGALQDYGIDFVVYDKNAHPGGLWADNYPNAKGAWQYLFIFVVTSLHLFARMNHFSHELTLFAFLSITKPCPFH